MVSVALVGIGSAGDVYPLLAIGRHLRSRGHEAVMLTNPVHASAVAAAGLPLLPIGEEGHYREAAAHPKLWHPIDGFGVFWRYLLRPALRPTYETLAALRSRATWQVIASPLAMGARLAQEKLGLPLVTAYTAAPLLRSVHDPMTVARWRLPRAVPHWARRGLWNVVDRHKLQPLLRPALDALRAELALPPLGGSVVGGWMHSPAGGIALFPSWFAPAAADWPARVRTSGFALHDADAQAGLPEALQDFLQAGPAPVVFMPGSAVADVVDFQAAALDACRRHGWRGVLLGPQAVKDLPATVACVPYAPFSLLLPRAQALVHHGGVGSSAQALRAGIPQLVLPRAYDQFDNALRLVTLGVGAAATLRTLGPALARLLHDPAVAVQCRAWAQRTDSQAAFAAVTDLVEAGA